MKHIKKILIVLMVSVILMISGCGPTRQTPVSDPVYSSMYFAVNTTYCQYQVDSMIRVDALAPIDKWIVSSMPSYSGGITEYLFIRKDGGMEKIYTLVRVHPADTIYKCTQKITK